MAAWDGLSSEALAEHQQTTDYVDAPGGEPLSGVEVFVNGSGAEGSAGHHRKIFWKSELREARFLSMSSPSMACGT